MPRPGYLEYPDGNAEVDVARLELQGHRLETLRMGNDKKYIKLNPHKMGFKFRGGVPRKEQSILSDALKALKKDMRGSWQTRLSRKEIFWLNVWQDEDDIEDDSNLMHISDPEIAKALNKWCHKAARRYCEPKAIIDGYGFVVNPIGSKHQVWHVDYTTDAAVVWVPMTPFTDKNAMQYITLPSNTPGDVLERVASNVDEVDVDALARGVDYLTVRQIVAKPMSVFYMGRGTIHRGIPNTGKEHRVTFYISVHFIKNYEKNYPYDAESMHGFEPSIAIFGK